MDEFLELLKKFDDGLPDQKPPIRRKILIIDDNPNIRQGLQRTLTQRHYEVIVTASDLAGVESLSDDICVVIAFINDEDVIRKILTHLNLWDVKRKLPPRAHAPPIDGFQLYDGPPAPSTDEYLTDPDYPVEAYF